MAISVVEEYVTETGKRKISLQKWPSLSKPWLIIVYVHTYGNKWVMLSTSEYYEEANARRDFEIRRPNMKVNKEEVPMQRGKRLVQEMLAEKLK